MQVFSCQDSPISCEYVVTYTHSQPEEFKVLRRHCSLSLYKILHGFCVEQPSLYKFAQFVEQVAQSA